jgi:uncharacterized protein YdiU (UPF0061 family)
LTLASETEPLTEALNTFGDAYKRALTQAMVERLGLRSKDFGEDADLASAAFRALAEGGAELRWEPFFFDWLGGEASEGRALNGRRAPLYAGEAFSDFRRKLGAYAAHRPERLLGPYFARPEPEELLYDEIEALWAPIAERDDWSLFDAKLERIEAARAGWGLA